MANERNSSNPEERISTRIQCVPYRLIGAAVQIKMHEIAKGNHWRTAVNFHQRQRDNQKSVNAYREYAKQYFFTKTESNTANATNLKS